MTKKSHNNKKNDDDNSIINFYELKEVKELIPLYSDPNFNKTQIKYNSRIGVIGSTGSGKTHWLLNFISRASNTFSFITVVHKMDETLYEFLEKKIGSKFIKFYKNIHDLPPLNDFGNKDKQQLLVFDDLVGESDKAHANIKDYFLRGRKYGRGITMIYLSQSFFRIPIFIRQQLNYLVIIKVSDEDDLKRILKNYALGIKVPQLVSLYDEATKNNFDFLKIDMGNGDINKKFSKNWSGFFKIKD